MREAWAGYAVIVLCCTTGLAGIVLGMRPPAPPQEEATTMVVPQPSAEPTASGKTESPTPPRQSALVIEDMVVGRGAEAKPGDKVGVHYVGTLLDGKEFDASRRRGEAPFVFDLGKGMVIKGWDQGVAGMRVGGKRKLVIPPHLAYGERGAGPIPPNSTLVFQVTVEDVKRGGQPAPATPHEGDPRDGQFTLSDALSDLPGSRPVYADIETSEGTLDCQLFPEKAPTTVANFVGLATGKRPSLYEGVWKHKPIYDGTTFHRVIRGFMIQGGDPKGTGTGDPGYTIKDEIWRGAKHDRPGLLCMANRGPNTNGAQFFITDASAPHLDGNYTIFGSCTPLDVVHNIATVPVTGERPTTPVTIKHVRISR